MKFKIIITLLTLPYLTFATDLLSPLNEQEVAAKEVITRQIGDASNQIELKIETSSTTTNENKLDWFELSTKGDKVLIRGNKGVSLTAGFYYYAKKYLNGFIGQMDRNLVTPKKLPLPATEKIETPFQIRNAYNYCTYSYTMAWWDWERWEREIDLLALYGVNQPLVIVGLEKVWQNVMKRLGFSEKEIADFIPTTAYTAWWLMGNLEGTSGPVPQANIDDEYQLALKMLERMRSLGMQPISQSFFGMVPSTFKKHYPLTRVINQKTWLGFKRPEVLSPTSRAFPKVAEVWYDELHKLYGKFDYYAGDLFHEGGFTGGINLTKAARNMEAALQKASPGAIYVMQGWGANPYPKLLAGLTDEFAMVQKLNKDLSNQSGNYGDNHKGKPWTMNFINNFGGGNGLYSNLQTVANTPGYLTSPENADCIGFGYLCEGTMVNPIFYDLVGEVFWSKVDVDLDAWVKNYVSRRYGITSPQWLQTAQEAWKLLTDSVYNTDTFSAGQTDSIMCARPAPKVNRARDWSSGVQYWDANTVKEAGLKLLEVAKAMQASGQPLSDSLKYDLTDVFRQILQSEGQAFGENEEKMMQVIADTDSLVKTNKNFLLGTWIADAKAKGELSGASDRYEVSARQLITSWETPSNSFRGLKDYSNRSWSGLYNDYYASRWNFYFNYEGDKTSEAYDKAITELENDWIYNDKTVYPTSPEEDVIKICEALVKKWLK